LTKKEWIQKKQDFLLPALIACLSHKWTLGGDPLADLQELGISLAMAASTLQDLVHRKIIKKDVQTYKGKMSIFGILTSPSYYREAIIFNDSHADLIAKNSLGELKNHWFRLERRKDE